MRLDFRFCSLLALSMLAACSSSNPQRGDTSGTGGAGATPGSGGAAGSATSSAGGASSGGAGNSVAGNANSSGGVSAAGAGAVGGFTGGVAGGPLGSGGNAGSSGGGAGTGGAGGGGTPGLACAEGRVGAHFVDATLGNDTNAGTSPATAWRSLTKVNSVTFQPGDSLCLRAGAAWTGSLAPQGSGTSAAPIVVDQYGTGARPRIAGGASDLQAVLLVNQQYWELNHLEITNDHGGPADLRGISVRGRDVGVLNHIVIRDSFIHAVTGAVNWIGGDVADNVPPWITFQTGWDVSKRTGGIVFEIESTNSTKTWFNDVVIENNTIQDTSFGGIIFKQLEGSVGWGVRSTLNDARFTPHTNITLRNNYLNQSGTLYGCNAIYMTGVRGGVIDGNVVQSAGTSGIEVYNSDDVRVQHNEVFGTVRKANGADFNGIDADRASTATLIQYNYIHDNGDGILLAQFAFGSSIVRYNLIINSSRYGINLHSDPASTNATYNNLFFAEGLNAASLVNTSGDGTHLASPYGIRNNILYTTRTADAARTGAGVTYQNNLYSGLPAVAGDAGAKTGNPMFMNAAARQSGGPAGPAFASLVGLRLSAGSPALNSGVAIANNGGVDFWNMPLYVGAPDIGPYEAP